MILPVLKLMGFIALSAATTIKAERSDLCFSLCTLSVDNVEQLMSWYKKNLEDAKDAFRLMCAKQCMPRLPQKMCVYFSPL